MAAPEIVTFGCRLNAFESGIIRRAAAEAGLADAIIVNTCAVTAEAERQARQAIRRARREHPAARIIVTGCAATLSPARYAAMAEVDRVLDNDAKLKAESYRAIAPTRPADAGHPPPLAGEGYGSRSSEPPPPLAGEGWGGGLGQARARAYLQVQQGCDHRCTFCIIPYARGPSRSVPVATIVAQARALVEAGAREIVLTGVDLTAYGLDLPERPSLGAMARLLLAAVPELKRLRLSSLDPSEIDGALWALFAEEPRLMPHLHLSLQAGDDLILKRMKRRHSLAQAIATVRRARALRPEVAIGADLIAGFPTEDEAMFRQSLELVEECGIAFLHVFPYSPRDGTPAARMPAVAPEIVRERAAQLREAGARALAADLARRVGSEGEVLIEKPGRGRAAFYAAVACPSDIDGIHALRFTGVAGGKLIGIPL
jgi:threonylcarbamoyladenosine tRNA methylthiotransferase MtaB